MHAPARPHRQLIPIAFALTLGACVDGVLAVINDLPAMFADIRRA